MKPGRFLCVVSSLFFLASIQACSHPQQVINSPCATLNATVQPKSTVALSLLFGSEAIRAAMDVITRQVTKLGSASTADLTSLGTDAAVRTAQARGINVKPEDRAMMETYLHDEVVPAIKQNPTCVINVDSSSTRPYFGVENVSINPDQSPQIVIKNSGQAETHAQILIRQFVNGSEHSRSQGSVTLGPGASRSVFVESEPLPISEVLAGKATLMVAISIYYLPESGKPVDFNEAWQYDHAYNRFVLVPVE